MKHIMKALTAGDIYEAIFDKTKQVKFRKKVLDEKGQVIFKDNYNYKYEDWEVITTESELTAFLGAGVPAGFKVYNPDQFEITDAPSHDNTIVELQGRKYLLTEVK